MILDETLKDGEMRIYKDLHNGWVEEEQTINVRQYGKTYQTMKEMQQQINQLTNNWNELEDLLKIKKARMLNEPDYSKYYLQGYETAILTTHSSHSGIMLETAKNSIVVLCDELLDKMKEIKGDDTNV